VVAAETLWHAISAITISQRGNHTWSTHDDERSLPSSVILVLLVEDSVCIALRTRECEGKCPKRGTGSVGRDEEKVVPLEWCAKEEAPASGSPANQWETIVDTVDGVACYLNRYFARNTDRSFIKESAQSSLVSSVLEFLDNDQASLPDDLLKQLSNKGPHFNRDLLFKAKQTTVKLRSFSWPAALIKIQEHYTQLEASLELLM
jgi:hypothetical protein